MFGGTDPNAAVYNEVIKSFEKTTGWKVEDSSEKSDQAWKDKVVQSFKNGNEADVVQFFTTSDALSFLNDDKLVSIEEIRKEFPSYAQNISESVLSKYAVPTTGFVEGLFTNTTHFKTATTKACLEKMHGHGQNLKY